jgi:hypothetical protein
MQVVGGRSDGEEAFVQTPTDIDTNGLDLLVGYVFPVFFSRGGAERALDIAERTQKAVAWLTGMVSMPTIPPLFVLDMDDWHRAALIPHYGLAHANRSRIVVGQQPSPFLVRLVERMRPNLNTSDSARLTEVYGDPPGFSRFADLLVCHELTHLADRPSQLDPGDRGGWSRHPRVLWVSELFANLGLQGYIQTNSPEELPALETLYEAISRTEPPPWRYTRLGDMYDAMMTPGIDIDNYVWFEFRLHAVLHGPLLADDEIIEVLADTDVYVARRTRDWLHHS